MSRIYIYNDKSLDEPKLILTLNERRTHLGLKGRAQKPSLSLLLAFIDCMEEQTRRKNEVVPPPLVCSTELSKLKAMFKAEIRDENRETVVQKKGCWVYLLGLQGL
jgi:hypothetical protein